jgi:hypothetical protein
MNEFNKTMIVLLLIILFIITNCEINFEEIDYSPFHNIIRKVLLNSNNISYNINTLNTTACAMPLSSIMFTYTTHYLIELIELQYKAMDQFGLKSCLLQRFIVVCLDLKCKQYCNSNNIINCVLINLPELPKSDFGKNSYHLITYIKHELMYEALKFSKEIFYFDIDSLLFKNPWTALKKSLFNSFKKEIIRNNNNSISNEINYTTNLYLLQTSFYDMFYQFERGFS